MSAEGEKFDILGEKIRKLVGMVRSLKSENEAVASDLTEARKQVETLRTTSERIAQLEQEARDTAEELERIKTERDEIRRKIEGLLGDLEGIDLS